MKMNITNENPPKKPRKRAEVAKKLVGLGAGILLSQQVGDAKLPTNFKEDENSGKKTEKVSQAQIQTVDEHTVAYDPNISFSGPEDEIAGTEPVPESDIAVPIDSAMPTVTAETNPETPVVAEKETKKEVKPEAKMEAPEMASMEINPSAVSEELAGVLRDMLKGKATLEKLQVTGEGGVLKINASLKGAGSTIGFVGDLLAADGGFKLGDFSLDAGWLVKKIAGPALKAHMPEALAKLKNRLEAKYKDAHPNGAKIVVNNGVFNMIFN